MLYFIPLLFKYHKYFLLKNSVPEWNQLRIILEKYLAQLESFTPGAMV